MKDDDDDNFEIITAPDDFEAVKDGLVKAGVPIVDAEVTMLPQNYVSLEGKEAETMLKPDGCPG